MSTAHAIRGHAVVVQPKEGLTPIPTPAPATPPPAAPPVAEPAPTPTMVFRPEAAVAAVPEPEPEPPRRRVVLSLEGREVPITVDRAVIGRSRECDVRLADTNVSRRHAELRREESAYWIVDLGSTNGTELNGKRVERARLSDGDRITLGSTDVVFGHEHP